MDAGSSISAAFDPVMVPAGFLAGQHGGDQVIFCAGHDVLSDRYPDLPQSNSQRRGVGCCIDLVVEDDDGVLRLDLEGRSVEETLRAIGRDDEAETVARVVREPLDTSLPVLASVLSRLFPSSRA